jgi:hypothetical protein
MKKDRELLEFAARAIGLTLRYNYLGGRDANQPWDPLEDDGDALRLAVSLRMDLNINDGECDVFTADSFYNGRGEDTLEATRRAIVCAAAAIGEQMQ